MSQSVKVAVDGCTLAARVDGDAGKPWIVLSNSLGADMSAWDGQMEMLTRRYRVLRYDTRGHGGSELSRTPVGFAEMAADVVALMDHFAIARAVFLGVSLGGMTGLAVALDHPGRLAQLVCCAARADAPPDYVRNWNERIAAVKAGGMAAVVDALVARWLSAAIRDARPDLAAAIAAMVRKTPPAAYIACAEALKTLDFLKRLPDMRVPTLYVAGETDPSAPPTVMKQMADATPGASFRLVAGAAHLINCDSPAGFAEAIAEIVG